MKHPSLIEKLAEQLAQVEGALLNEQAYKVAEFFLAEIIRELSISDEDEIAILALIKKPVPRSPQELIGDLYDTTCKSLSSVGSANFREVQQDARSKLNLKLKEVLSELESA